MTDELECDFCGEPLDDESGFRCRSESFTLEVEGLDVGSAGDWLACPACRRLVEDRDVEALVAKNPHLQAAPLAARAAVRGVAALVIEEFFRHWSGNVLPNQREPGDGRIEYLPAERHGTE